jgi:2,3-bisphosphoglycerate-independent phosphoglycerate mutase
MVAGAGVKNDASIDRYTEKGCARGRFQGLTGRKLMDLLFSPTIG